MRSLDIAGTGMQAQQTNVEVISNNIANMTTTGFKRRRAEFQDLLYQNLRRVGSNSSDTGTVVPAGAQIGLGVRTAAIYRINEQGNLQQTSNSLDVAIKGHGYFQVSLPSGETAFTRDGTFGLSPDGRLRDPAQQGRSPDLHLHRHQVLVLEPRKAEGHRQGWRGERRAEREHGLRGRRLGLQGLRG